MQPGAPGWHYICLHDSLPVSFHVPKDSSAT